MEQKKIVERNGIFMLSEDFLSNLKMSADIESIMTPYVNFKKAGRDLVCLCPFHSEKTPSCHVYTENNSFYCFGCGAGGDSITFIRLIENLDYLEAVRYLCERVGIPYPDENDKTADKRTVILELNREAARFFRDMLLSDAGAEAREYLYRRNLTSNTIKKYGIGFAPNSWNALKNRLKSKGYSEFDMLEASLLTTGNNGNVYDKFRNRVMFPIIDRRGNVIGFGGRVLSADDIPKYLNSSETMVFKKRENLFSLNFAKNTKEKFFILCEGNIDVITLNQSGFENSVATLGTAITGEQARLIKQYTDEVIIAYDSDSAGQKATVKAINLLSDAGISARVLKMDGAKDPDEYINRYSKEAFAEILEKSGSALSYELSKIEINVDMDTAEGRTEYLKKAVRLLSEIKNRLDRTVYIAETAKKCDLPVENVERSVDDLIKLKKRSEVKEEKRKLIHGDSRQMRDKINPDEYKFPNEAKAERVLIAYIFHSPEFLPQILSKITPDDFPTEFHRRVFNTLILRLTKGITIDISSLQNEFSVDEVGRIEGIKREGMELPFTKERFCDSIEVLERYKKEKNKKSAADLTDEEMKAYMQELKSKLK